MSNMMLIFVGLSVYIISFIARIKLYKKHRALANWWMLPAILGIVAFGWGIWAAFIQLMIDTGSIEITRIND